MDNDIETRRKWSGHWEFHEHGTLRVVGDGALGVSKSMHYETLLKESHSAHTGCATLGMSHGVCYIECVTSE